MEKRITISSTPVQWASRYRVYHRNATTVVASIVHAIAGPSACHPISSAPKLVEIGVGAQSVTRFRGAPNAPWP